MKDVEYVHRMTGGKRHENETVLNGEMHCGKSYVSYSPVRSRMHKLAGRSPLRRAPLRGR